MSAFEKLPETSAKDDTPQYVFSPIIKPKITKDSAIVDWFMSALIVIIAVAVIATYFIMFDVDMNIDIKKATVNTVWFAIGNFAIGALGKKIFRRKGEKTNAYAKAEEEANTAIDELCNSDYAKYAPAYCKDYTKRSLERYREHQLVAVGLSLAVFNEKWLGKGFSETFKAWRKKNITFLQFRAIWRCNAVKVQAYNPNFILSYNSSMSDTQAPSSMYNSKRSNAFDNVKSAVMVTFSALGIGFMFSDVILNFSVVVLFAAIVKTIMLAINLALKATFGWNLSIMDIKRNKLRASEAKACVAWAKKNQSALHEESQLIVEVPGEMAINN